MHLYIDPVSIYIVVLYFSSNVMKSLRCLSPFDLLNLLVFDDLLSFQTLSINALSPLYGLDVLCELALSLTCPPSRQVAFEDVVDFLEGASGGFGVHEEDVDRHCRAQDAKNDV